MGRPPQAAVSRTGQAVDSRSGLTELRDKVHRMLMRKVDNGIYDDAAAPGAFRLLARAVLSSTAAPVGLTEGEAINDLVSDFRASLDNR